MATEDNAMFYPYLAAARRDDEPGLIRKFLEHVVLPIIAVLGFAAICVIPYLIREFRIYG